VKKQTIVELDVIIAAFLHSATEWLDVTCNAYLAQSVRNMGEQEKRVGDSRMSQRAQGT